VVDDIDGDGDVEVAATFDATMSLRFGHEVTGTLPRDHVDRAN